MRKKAVSIIVFIVSITVILGCPALLRAEKIPGVKTGGPQLQSPMRLAMTPEGNLLVSDSQLGMIVTVDPINLKALRGFPVQGKPLAVAYARGYIYVGNTTRECVEVYSRGGKKLYQLKGVIKQPTDIAIDESEGLVFVVDAAQKNVKVFDLRGTFLRSFPGVASNLISPTGIALDPANNDVFICDYGDQVNNIYPRIQIFDYNGILEGTISGKKGMLGVRFSRPQGLAVDNSGHVFMVDCYSGEIMIFDRYNGSLLKTLSGFGTDPGKLMLPLDMVMNPTTKDIYITNNRAAVIVKLVGGGGL